MTPHEVFERTAQNAERLAATNLGRYKLNVAAFAALGYLVIFGLLLALAALIGGIAGAALVSTALFLLLLKNKLLLFVLPVIWVLIKSLWVRIEAPKGYELRRAEFPELYRELDELRRALRSIPIHRVLLTSEFNAAIAQSPRLGIFGWQRNTLVLGLELLLVLSPEQARAVVAHELGHLSGNHSRFNGWIYRVRLSWQRIMEALDEQNGFGVAFMKQFFDWYAPRFAAYSFVLARRNEYEADAMSVELTSREDTAAALVNTYVTASQVEQNYWRSYFWQADEISEPPHPPWAGLTRFLHESITEGSSVKGCLDQMLAVTTSYEDTHPALKDRLAALGVPPVVPPQPEQSAARAWLGTRFDAVIADFDRDWYMSNSEKWHARHQYVVEGRQKLSAFEACDWQSLADAELWQFGVLTEEFRSPSKALPLFEAYRMRNPQDLDVTFVLGRILHGNGDAACLDYFKQALGNPALAMDACRYAWHFLNERERHDEAVFWDDAAQRIATENEAARRERAQLMPGDALAKAGLTEAALTELVAQLKRSRHVGRAWIARKVVQHRPDVPVFAIAFTAKGMHLSADSVIKKVASEISFEHDLFLVPKIADYKKLAKHIIKHGEQIV